MIFKDNQHHSFFLKNIESTHSEKDPYRRALFYALGLTKETRKYVNRLYDFEENGIRIEGLEDPWQTGTTMRICRLAFNLYNGSCAEFDESERTAKYTPYWLFGGDLTIYMLEAVKVRFGYEHL